MVLQGKEQICKYIPQRDPIVMVDTLYEISPDVSVTGLTIEPDNMFVHDGALRDGAVVEHMAQSGALHIGYEHVSRGLPVPIGLIGSLNKIVWHRLPRVGEQLKTTIVMEARVGDVTLVGATVRVGDEVVVEGKLKVATPE